MTVKRNSRWEECRWVGRIRHWAPALLGAAVFIQCGTGWFSTQAGTVNVLPTDDAYLQGTTRFNDSTLKVEAGRRVSYLKFAVSGLSGAVQSATLRLQENGDIGGGTVRVYRGSHNNWTETTLSTANAPTENGQVGVFSGAVGSAQVVNVDVTMLVSGNGTYSVLLKQDTGGNDIWFGSEESPRRPQLIIQTADSGPVTHSLTVNGGSGSGDFAAGTSVSIGAAAAPAGQVFDRWTGDVGNLANVNAALTSIVMPAANVTVTATYKTAGGGGTLSFLPTDDAYLQGTTRFNDSTLKVEAGRRVSYLKFAVSGLSGAVQSATLRLQENGDIGGGTVRVYRGSHNNWTETTLSTANAPAQGVQVGGYSGSVGSAQAVSMDVTPLVIGNGTYSVILKLDAGGNDIWFGSEESARKPQLIVEMTSGGTVTYSLTVNKGSGSGNYAAGTSVSIGAAAAPAGQVFDRWTGDVANLANVNAAVTSIVMPAANVTVTATYRAGGGIGGIGGIEPIEGMTATGNAGMITSIHGIPVSELRLGVTFFPNPPKYSVHPARNGDNFDLNLLGSADDQPYFEVYFGQSVMGMLLIENGGNDSGFMQGLDASGNLVGPKVSFSTSDYLQTSYRSGNNQTASGLFVWMQVPVFGVRVTPPSGGTMGLDPISVSALVDEPAAPSGSLSPLSDFSEVWNGQTLLWRKARYVDPTLGTEGSAGIPFGLALPHGYTAGAGQKYPLVLYLHGAGARGNDDNLNLQRPTARFFAHQARTEPAFNAFVLSPQLAIGQQFVNVAFDHGPYEQSATTLMASMRLTENLVHYLTDPANHTFLGAALGFSAAEVDVSRVYLVGDSMGAYGAWDTLGRGSMDYAAAIASAGSGPVNRLAAILGTPLWVIHGEVDGVVPNFLPYLGDADGAGSLGMLGLMDPAFENTASTALIRLDNYSSAADDPTPADTLIYSQYPAQFTHATVAGDWTGTMVSDFSSWLFAQVSTGASSSQQAVMSGYPPRLELAWDSNDGGWYLIWPDAQWVLQEAMSLDGAWIDVFPPASSPHPVGLEENGDQRFYRLRAAEQQ